MARTTAKSPPPRRPGRPSILTEKLADEILGYARAGNYIKVAAKAAGVAKQTLYNWQAKAAEFDDATQEQLDALDEETALLVWFVDALKQFEAQAEVEALAAVRSQSSRWQAQAWFLERRHQDRYRQLVAQEHSGDVRVAISPEQAKEEAESWAAAGAGVAAVASGPDAVEPPEDA